MLIPHLLSALLYVTPTQSDAIDTSGLDAESKAMVAKAATLSYKTGNISVPEAKSELDLPAGYRFLDASDAKKVLVEIWGNPPSACDGVLGMVFAPGQGPLGDKDWGVVLTYDDQGHIDDKDAEGINYDELLTDLKKGTEESNEERVKEGGRPLHLVNWAERPTYDKENHILYWAKELDGGGADHSLNYDVRILGREGILSLNAISPMSQLASVKTGMREMFPHAKFVSGQAYNDYKSGDKLSKVGIAALVAGGVGVAAKAGLFKGLIIALLAAKKLLIGLAIAAFAGIKALLSSKKKEEPRFGQDLSDSKKKDGEV